MLLLKITHLLLAAVVVPHCPGHLLVVHLLGAVGLHHPPGAGELGRVGNLEDAL